MRELNFSILHDQCVIAINDSFLHYPETWAVCSLDAGWMSKRQQELNEFRGRKFLCVRQDSPRPAIADAEFLPMETGRNGLNLEWPVVHGRITSGYVAVNIAVLLGANRIALIGFDYDGSGTHWHQEYAWRASTGVHQWKTYADVFSTMNPQLNELGIEVMNFSPDSSVSAFPKHPLSDLRQWYD